ncbi:MAG: Gfo/Idh/MocA family oxidoreductase [Chlamydiota bacterium]
MVALKKSQNSIIIIGAAGRQGKEYFHLLSKLYKISGLVDTNYKALKEAYNQSSIPLFHTVEEAIEQCSFTTAVICIPHSYHFSATLPLINANKTVIKEKPLALTQVEVNRYKEQEKNHIFTIVQRPFHEAFFFVQKNLYRLGKIYDFHYQYYLGISERTKGWRSDFSLSGGGVIIDMGYHILDVIINFFGQPEEISGALSYCYDYSGRSHLEDAATITCRYSNNQLHGSIRLNRYAESKREYFEVLGSNGRLTMQNGFIEIKDRKGNLLEQIEISDPLNKQKMFDFYFEQSSCPFFSEQHLNHHAVIVALIEQLYKRIR